MKKNIFWNQFIFRSQNAFAEKGINTIFHFNTFWSHIKPILCIVFFYYLPMCIFFYQNTIMPNACWTQSFAHFCRMIAHFFSGTLPWEYGFRQCSRSRDPRGSPCKEERGFRYQGVVDTPPCIPGCTSPSVLLP